MQVALEAENVRKFIFWGFIDRFSRIPGWFPDADAGLLFDREYEPKPAYFSARDRLRGQ